MLSGSVTMPGVDMEDGESDGEQQYDKIEQGKNKSQFLSNMYLVETIISEEATSAQLRPNMAAVESD